MVPGCALDIHRNELQTTLRYLLLVYNAHLAVNGNAEKRFFLSVIVIMMVFLI